ncbi:hypothetical protein BU14_0234s0044 [Porphyra umbilicalis]|uniref:Uncharacterized protein n=1 Tax=Porphyra umbilicalis TaxID=2786 RepID=A0A1X6P3V1_PORUM|nr:hypothetical protein BU14_0234s0044 [Porphyra umbilicalis]|eukprot:OSX75518.1 hypothetical protein BU14_0234s0044 [Porphyra umbilicalis]
MQVERRAGRARTRNQIHDSSLIDGHGQCMKNQKKKKKAKWRGKQRAVQRHGCAAPVPHLKGRTSADPFPPILSRLDAPYPLNARVPRPPHLVRRRVGGGARCRRRRRGRNVRRRGRPLRRAAVLSDRPADGRRRHGGGARNLHVALANLCFQVATLVLVRVLVLPVLVLVDALLLLVSIRSCRRRYAWLHGRRHVIPAAALGAGAPRPPQQPVQPQREAGPELLQRNLLPLRLEDVAVEAEKDKILLVVPRHRLARSPRHADAAAKEGAEHPPDAVAEDRRKVVEEHLGAVGQRRPVAADAGRLHHRR